MKGYIYRNLNANLPFTIIETREIERADRILINIVREYIIKSESDMNIFLWRFGTGWINIEKNSHLTAWRERSNEVIYEDRDYLSALRRMETEAMENSVCILNNFLYAFHNQGSIPMFVEKISEMYDRLKEKYVNCFIVGKMQPIPTEISQLFATIKLPLPDEKELATLIFRILNEEKIGEKKKLVKVSKKMALLLKGLTEKEVERATYTSIVSKKLSYKTIYNIKKDLVKQTGFLEIIDTSQENKLGGLNNFKNHYKKVALYFKQIEKAKKYGLTPPRGCCLVGIQGCGKSLSAKMLAELFEIPLYRWDIGSMLGQFVGQSEENTRQALELITSVSPCIVLIDEAEKLFSGYGTESSGVIGRVLGDILYFMEEKNTGSFFMFTTNSIDNLPPELLRAGRLDDIWFVDMPNKQAREEIFSIHTKNKVEVTQDEIKTLAANTEDFTGADIENAIKHAQYDAFEKNKPLSYFHIERAIKEIKPFGKTNREFIENLRQWAKNKAKIA